MKRTLILMTLCLFHLGFAQEDPAEADKMQAFHENLMQHLDYYDLRQWDGRSWLAAIDNGEPVSIELLGFTVEADLQPHSLRAAKFRAVTVQDDGSEIVLNRPVSTFRGSLRGIPDSELRLTITDRMIAGTIRMEGEVFFLQPATKFASKMASDITVVYNDADVHESSHAFCGMKYHEDAALKLLKSANLSSNPQVVQIALDTDGEFVQAHPGVGISDLLEGYVNQLDAIWQANLNLQLEITAVFVRPNPGTDPWSNTIYGHGPLRYGQYGGGGGNCLQPGDGLWEQFSNYWNSTGSFSHDIMVLFVGRDMKICPTATSPEAELFGTAGALGSICRYPDRAYVVMEEYTTNTAGLMAHEIGHSLNGIHIFTSDCDPGPPIGPVLCGTVEPGSDYYSATNKSRIASFLATYGSCLGDELSFPIVADSYTLPQWPNNNYGSNTRVFIREGKSGYLRNGYFKFTVSGLTSSVSSAYMRVKTGPVVFPSATLYKVNDNSWGEFTITWNNAPTNFSGAYTIGSLPADSWVDIDVSSIVTGNGTFTIGMVAPDIPNLYFRSRQTAEKPTLILFTDD